MPRRENNLRIVFRQGILNRQQRHHKERKWWLEWGWQHWLCDITAARSLRRPKEWWKQRHRTWLNKTMKTDELVPQCKQRMQTKTLRGRPRDADIRTYSVSRNANADVLTLCGGTVKIIVRRSRGWNEQARDWWGIARDKRRAKECAGTDECAKERKGWDICADAGWPSWGECGHMRPVGLAQTEVWLRICIPHARAANGVAMPPVHFTGTVPDESCENKFHYLFQKQVPCDEIGFLLRNILVAHNFGFIFYNLIYFHAVTLKITATIQFFLWRNAYITYYL